MSAHATYVPTPIMLFHGYLPSLKNLIQEMKSAYVCVHQ